MNKNDEQPRRVKMADAVGKALAAMEYAGLKAPTRDSVERTSIWTSVLLLAGMPPEDVLPTAQRLVLSAEWFPTPAAFIKAWRPPEDVEAQTELAWQSVLRCIDRYGSYASISAEDLDGDAAACWVLARMGWQRIREQLTDDTRSFIRAEFARAYTAARKAGFRQAYIRGAMERQNALANRDLTPALIGRPELDALPAACTRETDLELPGAMTSLSELLASIPDENRSPEPAEAV